MAELITYNQTLFEEDVISLYKWCNAEDFIPDAVVGIMRGGLVPATYLSHKFNKPLIPLNWSTRDFLERDYLKWTDIVIRSTEGRKFLIVEDIVDSGVTMKELFSSIKEYSELNLPNIQVVSLWNNTDQRIFTPNYWTNSINRAIDKRWVVFPWEV